MITPAHVTAPTTPTAPTSSPPPPTRHGRLPVATGRRQFVLLGAAVALLYMTSPVVTNFDSYLAVPTAVSIVHDGDLDLDEFGAPAVRGHYGFRVIGSHGYDVYPWPVALVAVPAVVAVDLLHAAGIGPGSEGLVEGNDMGPLHLVLAAVVTAVAVVLVTLLAHERLTGDESRRRRLALAFGLAFATGTAAWSTASRALWQHGPSMALAAGAVLAAARLEHDRRAAPWAAALGAILAGAYAVRPTNAVLAAALGTWVVVRHRRRMVPFAAGAAVVAGAWATVNLTTYGSALPPYHSVRRLALHDRFLEAVAANLVSPARGLLVFSPIVVLAVVGVVHRWRRRAFDGLDVAVALAVIGHLIVVSASREGWWAGHAFGPRFMTDVLPLLAWLAVPAVDAVAAGWAEGRARAAAVAVGVALLWSVAVNAQGGWLRTVHCWNVTPANIDRDPGRVWSVSDPQVLSGWRALTRMPVDEAVLGPCPGKAPPAGT